MAETDAAAAVAPELRPLLGVGHPHNAALQIWVELGAVGAALTATALLLLLRLMASLRTESLAPRLALLMGAAAVSLVGHGAWQGWWPAALGAAILWLRSTDRLNAEGPA
jgi:O-antigen ligase